MSEPIKKKCESCGQVRKVPKNRKLCHHCRRLQWQVSKGEILPPDFEDTSYEPYKDPMIPNESGFGYIGAIIQSKSGSHIQCNECGYFFRDLGQHLKHYHKIEARDYKLKYGLRVSKGLISPQMRVQKQKTFNEHPIRQRAKENSVLAQKALKESRAKGKKPYNDNNSWIPQLRNERGVCEEQLKVRIKQLAEKYGRPPLYSEFIEEFGSGAMFSVRTIFGTWNNALLRTGLPTYRQRVKTKTKNSAQAILNMMSDWYDEHNRTPQYSDFVNDDNLPTPKRVLYYFGTINKAREEAGIPLLERRNGKWIEVI